MLRGPSDGSFAYSDAGTHLLSAVLTQATGQSALEFARANLFDPLEIPSGPAFDPVYIFLDDVQDEAFWTVLQRRQLRLADRRAGAPRRRQAV